MPTSTELPLSSAKSIASGENAPLDELSHLKRQLLQAEVRLARARATAAGAEADVKVLTARLRAVIR
jgi:hypothetical protein